MYIAIEGVKGSGKSTLVEHLQTWLQASGIAFDLLCPTKPMPIDHDLEQQALLPFNVANDSFREQLYAARSNYHAARVNIKKPLILGDRSIFTSFVTRWPSVDSVGMAEYVSYVRGLESRIPYPDHVIVLSLPDDILYARLAARQRHYGLHDECISRLQAAKKAYAALEMHTKALGVIATQWHHFDSNKPISDLVDLVGGKVLELMRQPQHLCA